MCAVLNLDAQSANSSLPSPDAQSTTLLATAYQSLGDGANTCYNAYGSPKKRSLAQHFLRLALAQLSFGSIRLAIASGS